MSALYVFPFLSPLVETQQKVIDSKTWDVPVLNVGVAIDFMVCIFLWKHKKELWTVRGGCSIFLLATRHVVVGFP